MSTNQKLVVLVIGGSSPVGRNIAQRLSRDYIVYSHYNSNTPEHVEGVNHIQQDIQDHTGVKRLIETVHDKEGSLDVLVNAIGPIIHTNLDDLSIEEYHEQMRLNLDVVFYSVFYANKYLSKRKGHVINFTYAGVEHLKSQIDTLPYSIAKAGVVTLSKTIAANYADRNIRCNMIAPGFIDSEIVTDSTRERAQSIVPLKRLAECDEIAETVAWLLESPEYITGASVNIAGGLEF